MPLRHDGPQRRYNPLLDEWVLTSPHRLERPWQGRTEPAGRAERPAYDPECYLCPGNTRTGGARNPDYTSTFAFDNDFSALGPPRDPAAGQPTGLLRAQPEWGACRVVCFSPRHDLRLARMLAVDIRGIIDAWIGELSELGGRDTIQYVQIFENRGELMGCSNPHPHGQVWAVGHIPTIPARKLATQRKYFERHGSDLLGDYVDIEIREGERVVCANADWVAVVPFWAVWPYEVMVIPVRHVSDLTALHDAERDALADLLSNVTVRYDNLFQCDFPYSMGWHGCPTDGREHPAWRLHAVYYPPLLRSATIRKFLVGYELTGEPQRDLTPEAAAAQLRAAPTRHYLDTETDTGS